MCVQALCAAVVLPDVLQTMALVFSGADVMCATGDPTVSTPYLLAQRAGQRLQMEFLHQNKLSGKQLRAPPPQAAMVLSSCMVHMQSTVITVMDLPLNFQLTLTALGLHLMFIWMIVKAEAKTNRSPAKTLATSPLDASCRRHSFISGQC